MTNTHAFPNGVAAAVCTPVKADLSIDHELLYQHSMDLLGRGCHGIIYMGTTGESTSFSVEEREEALDELISRGFPANRIMVGTGLCSLTDTLRLTRHATNAQCGGVLVMPPFYFRAVDDEGLYQYFARLIERTANNDLRLFLYHFPRMSGIDMSIDLMVRLAQAFPRQLVGIKDSSGDLDHMLKVMDRIPDFRLYTGSEKVLKTVIEHGGAGCISATANYSAGEIRAVYDAVSERRENMAELERTMVHIREAFEGFTFASALKGILARRNSNPGWNRMRPPLMPLTEAELDTIDKALKTFPQ